MSTWMSMNFQDANSLMSMMMMEFHDFMMMILIIILMFIMYMMMNFIMNKNLFMMNIHNHLLETIWTIIPMIIILFMAIPSLKILYMIEESLNNFMTIKTIGHQWYWSYEYSDFLNIKFDSFMMKYINDSNNFRLLDVDNRLILPYQFKIKNMLTSSDVIHSWTMPNIGIKTDCIPGRINQCMILMHRSGVFYGQCSEICGINHSFMPIVIESINLKFFFKWMNSY